mmetsp:Transcript_26571/g.56525  ORF Transcript_26571/g.56525 Transcript_26571/m.56525 type:complete len:153 (-) Transcript_26571:266-724(-)|eukprot:CAMPEP_0172535434 /NCGR_PEP_ID=MMETSP1067-20121228/7445_1 /TAXON_ID=265564 ORGANISM="Thalassiosira punctigera, Strain Tpunct2005C2" /NCGR_SAMPLE_ID=MMETSP1067 /ASSEMBLY_ACC=CAM_ASM_000444 /LENGTH=152 /DNA_ID=CAMNT_0013320367 /DNA_START=155 /DNA_END=613 /DNA_ORIENTATION=-
MWKQLSNVALISVALASVHVSSAFSNNLHKNFPCIPNSSSALAESFDDEYEQPKKKGFFANFFEELDAFVDDATSRRLGAGAQYYGKRKSSFYGKEDSNRKRDRDILDPTEDYRGPSNAGYFKWVPDPETGQMKPVTRLKEVNIEKKSRFER